MNDALLPANPQRADELRMEISQKLFDGRMYWKPLFDRMDYGLTLYKLLDPIQQAKPTGFRRFVSNDPRTAIDAAVSLLTRNNPYWRGDMPTGMAQAERERVGKIEHALSGIVDAFDYLFRHRGDMGGRFWKQAAFFALMRGWIWGKFQVTTQATRWGLKTPLLGEFYDPRQVIPNYDGVGLESVIVLKDTTMAEMMMQYGSKVRLALNYRPGGQGTIDSHAAATKIEYWSNDRYLEDEFGTPFIRRGEHGVLGYFMTSSVEAGQVTGVNDGYPDAAFSTWLIDPFEHGYSPDALPIIGVPVNGIPIQVMPQYSQGVITNMSARMTRLGGMTQSWHGPGGFVADSGRGLLTSVEEHIPQYNELLATIFQHFTIGTYGTWVFKTQTGELPPFEDGSNAKIPLHIGEDVQKFVPEPINQDAYKLMEILQDERQRGMLNNILQANGGLTAQSGIVLQQTINAALNSLEPFGSGLEDFGMMFQEHMLEQLRTADIGTLSLVARGSNRSYVRMEFDPKSDLDDRKYSFVPIFKPAVPEDLMTKAQAATLLLNPRNPMMSIITVLQEVFQLEDPEGEMKRMLEDIANRDPVILLERIATILDEEGESDMADRIRQKEFQAKFADDVQQMQLEAEKAQLEAATAQQQQPQPQPGTPVPGPGGPGMVPGPVPGGPGPAGAPTAGGPMATVQPGQGGPDLNPGGGLGVVGQ